MTVHAMRMRLGDRVLAAFGRKPEARAGIVRGMLSPRSGDVIGYWLQLVIAAMLATLGLALNSTAVVIGAMLIAPLMRPIVEVGMGLAAGSAALALRAAVRTTASICVVAAIAIAIAWLLPFRTITPQLEARTAPTLLISSSPAHARSQLRTQPCGRTPTSQPRLPARASASRSSLRCAPPGTA